MYNIEAEPVGLQSREQFILVLRDGQSDYANCAGTYELSFIKVRSRPMYYNAAKHRIIFYDGGRWVITAEHYLRVVLNGATGGFYASQGTSGQAHDANFGPRYDNI